MMAGARIDAAWDQAPMSQESFSCGFPLCSLQERGYTVVEDGELGKGGFGKVYLVKDKEGNEFAWSVTCMWSALTLLNSFL